MKHQLVQQFAESHHGVVTLDAAMRAGVARRTYFRAVADGQLEHLYPGVARIYGSAPTRKQATCAACLAAGPGAMASHRSSAHLWGVPRPDDDAPELILPDRNREVTLDGVIVHRPRDLRDLIPGRRANIPTTNILRMLCDIGAVDPDGVHAAVGHIVTNAMASPDALKAAIDRHSRRGRPGVPAFRAALADWVIDGKALDSEFERLMKRLIQQHRLPPMQFHAAIAGYEVDFWVIDTPIVVECDGWEFHDKRRDRFELDRERRNALTNAGYIVVEITYRLLKRHPQRAAKMILGAVGRWANTGSPTLIRA